MRVLILLGFLVFPCISSLASPGRDDWQASAARITGESEKVRVEAVARLRATPDLERKLADAFKTPARGLALDTIAALELKPMLPLLVQAIDEGGDRDGQIHLTLNSLIGPDTRETLVARYRLELDPQGGIAPQSAASRMAILDGLALMREPLPVARVRSMLRDTSYEVRSAALLYAEVMTRKLRAAIYLPVIQAALHEHPMELRLEAIHAVRSLDPRIHPAARRVAFLRTCSDDANPQVREACRKAFPEGQLSSYELALLSAPTAAARDSSPRESGMDLFTRNQEYLRGIEDEDPRRCVNDYRRFYSRGRTDIRIVFGYKDARPARFVGDRYERAALIEHLTRSCAANYHACGFKRDPDSGELLTRLIPGPGGALVRVELHVVESSLSPDDNLNRQSPEQFEKSRRARATFLEGLAHADAVFYLGHSRAGGGPDFRPPRLRSDRHVDYTWYRAHRQGFEDMLETLARSERKPRLLGLFSCFSERLFEERLHRLYPAMGLITSPSWAYSDDEVTEVVAAVNSLLGMWCPAEFEKALDAAVPVHVLGFFSSR